VFVVAVFVEAGLVTDLSLLESMVSGTQPVVVTGMLVCEDLNDCWLLT